MAPVLYNPRGIILSDIQKIGITNVDCSILGYLAVEHWMGRTAASSAGAPWPAKPVDGISHPMRRVSYKRGKAVTCTHPDSVSTHIEAVFFTIHDNHIDEARQTNGPGTQTWEPSKCVKYMVLLWGCPRSLPFRV